MSEVRSQRSKVRGQRSKVKGQCVGGRCVRGRCVADSATADLRRGAEGKELRASSPAPRIPHGFHLASLLVKSGILDDVQRIGRKPDVNLPESSFEQLLELREELTVLRDILNVYKSTVNEMPSGRIRPGEHRQAPAVAVPLIGCKWDYMSLILYVLPRFTESRLFTSDGLISGTCSFELCGAL